MLSNPSNLYSQDQNYFLPTDEFILPGDTSLAFSVYAGGFTILITPYEYQFFTDRNPDISNQYDIHPNPFQSHITVSGFKSTEYKINLFSADGRELNNLSTELSGEQFIINTANLPSGIYLLVLKHEKGGTPIKRKLVKF